MFAKPDVELDDAPIDFAIGPSCFNSEVIVTGNSVSLKCGRLSSA
jgi:hypothetical protein